MAQPCTGCCQVCGNHRTGIQWNGFVRTVVRSLQASTHPPGHAHTRRCHCTRCLLTPAAPVSVSIVATAGGLPGAVALRLRLLDTSATKEVAWQLDAYEALCCREAAPLAADEPAVTDVGAAAAPAGVAGSAAAAAQARVVVHAVQLQPGRYLAVLDAPEAACGCSGACGRSDAGGSGSISAAAAAGQAGGPQLTWQLQVLPAADEKVRGWTHADTASRLTKRCPTPWCCSMRGRCLMLAAGWLGLM